MGETCAVLVLFSVTVPILGVMVSAVAFAEEYVSVALAPLIMDDGETAMVHMGGGKMVRVAGTTTCAVLERFSTVQV